ncbi:ORF6N domain-containing protein [Ligilactobacillus ruminis]|uniref:ORF6N domain-containing protein n=1 Tax=Ligilactobacillus ruminis TaxID=1623 RepID=UPI003F9CEDB4
MKLKVLGQEKIGQYEFTGIEGGFGKNKRAMLVKDIAAIHRKEVKEVNRLINSNINRFKFGIDLLDLKQVISNHLFSEYGFTKAQWGNANNIYLLSERGYAKLLKILEDDKAWEIYDELVDNYFNMREAINTDSTIGLKDKRLAIMEENAKTKQAQLLFKVATGTASNSARERIFAHIATELTGEKFIPEIQKKEFSAQEVGDKFGITANKVGRIANILDLKAEQPGENQFGRWAMSKSQYSNKEVAQWLYYQAGVNKIAEFLREG